ncbi:MAG: hypothetical protein M0042_09055 [Nitrospiraceae bacterium]|nr:hypothetical protein [Nitrospiraceae bacterium]
MSSFPQKRILLILVLLAACAAGLAATGSFNFTGNCEGLFLLRGADGKFFQLQDDLYLNEEQRYIAGFDLDWHGLLSSSASPGPSLSYSWNEKTGTGYVRNYLPGNRQLFTSFSRFRDDAGKDVHGLFVGGGLPWTVRGDDLLKKNETGMAYFDGNRWYHIWCNVNEALFSFSSFTPLSPSSWEYLGSRVLHHNNTDLVIGSSHRAVISGVPVRIDRYAQFRAGEAYFILSVFLKNIGDRQVSFDYLYGDEPWLGNYGSSAGNVGWAAEGLHEYVGRLDADRTSFIGFYDHGNDAIGEGHSFTEMANFIEWFGAEKPLAYFSNGPYERPGPGGRTVPISGNTRYLGILWGPERLEPGGMISYTMAIGMALPDPETGMPRKPEVDTTEFP